MKYNRDIRRRHNRGERGVALLFALGILAVVIVTVLIFAQRASTDLKIASALSSETGAKLLAKSALNRVMLTMQGNAVYTNEFFSFPLSGEYSSEPSQDETNGDCDWLWKLNTADYPFAKVYDPGASAENVRWQYIKSGTAGTDPVVGRIAFRAYAENKLNLNAIADKNNCNGSSDSDPAKTEKRGVSAAELDFNPATLSSVGGTDRGLSEKITRDIISGHSYATLEDAVGTLLGSTPSDVQLYAVDRYFNVSDSTLLNEADAWYGGGPLVAGAKDPTKFYHRFNLRQADWDTIAGLSGNGGGGNAAVEMIAKAAVAFFDSSRNVVNTESAIGIPWLKHWNETSGNWDSKTDKCNQIIANLINYCASESSPVVSNIAPANWSGEEGHVPAYTGNKRTYYLNAVNFKLSATAGFNGYDRVQIGETEYRYKWKPVLTLSLDLHPELIKMYKTVLGGAYSVKVYGTVSVTYQKNDAKADYTNAIAADGTWTLTCSGASITSSPGTAFTASESTDAEDLTLGYKKFYFGKGTGDDHVAMISDTVSAGEYWTTADAEPTNLGDIFKIKSVTVSGLKIVVSRGSENVDYSTLCTTVPGFSEAPLSSKLETAVYSFSYQTADPRHNLHAADWTAKDLKTLGTPNAEDLSKPYHSGDTRDEETASSPVWVDDTASGHISTAYIRHAPMQSLWELGAIHRAAPWQTINLTRPDPATAPATDVATDISTNGGGDYKDGDYRILDQVTLGRKKIGPLGKINLNFTGMARNFTFDALFRNMVFDLKGDYELASGSSVTLSDSTNQLSNSKTRLKALGGSGQILNRRSDIYASTSETFWQIFTHSPATATDGASDMHTDALKEQMIGRIIHLTDATSAYDSAVVVILAQTIQDVGGTVYPDLNEDGLTATTFGDTAKINLGFRTYDGTDASTYFSLPSTLTRASGDNPQNGIEAQVGRYDNGADRITGECLLTARLLYDKVKGKWKVVQVKYAE